ncbi:MAG: hypothetical protein V3U34_00655 [candidate division NC10 bacterium]
MPEISDKQLAKYEEATEVLEDYDGGGSDKWRQRRLEALRPIRTPLVSDEELTELFVRFRADGTGGLNGVEELLARRIVALSLRKAAEKLEAPDRPNPMCIKCAEAVRFWAGEEDSP